MQVVPLEEGERGTVRALETNLEKKVCENAVIKYGVLSIKLSPPGQVGWPDRLFLIHGGRPLLIEFKLPWTEPEPMQDYRHDMLKALNYDVEVCDNYEDAMATIGYYVDAARLSKERG